MANLNLNQYIEKNYQKFLDYANYHASKNGLHEYGNELLNFVLEIVLYDMDREKVLELLGKKYGNYNELHTYILGMIKINAFSPRSDFHRKVLNLNRLPIDENVTVNGLDIIDEVGPAEEKTTDRSEEVFQQFETVRRELECLHLSERAKDIFRWKFFHGNHLSEWPGIESQEKLYDTYNQVLEALKERINGKGQLQLF